MKKYLWIWGVLCLLCLSGFAWPVQAAEKPRVAVMNFQNNLNDNHHSINEAAALAFQESILDSGLFRVVDRERIQDVLKELGFSQTAYVDPNKALEVGKMVSAQYLITGKIVSGTVRTSGTDWKNRQDRTYAEVTTSVTVIKVETGDIVFSRKADGLSTPQTGWSSDRYTPLLLEAAENACQQIAKAFIQHLKYGGLDD